MVAGGLPLHPCLRPLHYQPAPVCSCRAVTTVAVGHLSHANLRAATYKVVSRLVEQRFSA